MVCLAWAEDLLWVLYFWSWEYLLRWSFFFLYSIQSLFLLRISYRYASKRMYPPPFILLVSYSMWKLCVQVSSATATFAMMFSSSMSVVEYYLLKRFPVPYGNCYLSRPSYLYRISLLIFFNFLSSLLCCCCNYCCFYRATRCSKVDYSFGSCFIDNIHSGIHNLCQCNITWWAAGSCFHLWYVL